ncbi:MAG: hypothetical protein AAF639_33820 [Chloroflexota bacterium]
MTTNLAMQEVQRLYHKTAELESEIKAIQDKIKETHLEIVHAFYPYLMSIYEKWRPRLGEVAILINFDGNYCHEITIREVNGYWIRAQRGNASVYHNIELNVALEEYLVPTFIIPKQNFEEIKSFFNLTFIGEVKPPRNLSKKR